MSRRQTIRRTEMANKIPLTLEGAKRQNPKPVEDDVRPEGGI
jgi:hypothetical protein